MNRICLWSIFTRLLLFSFSYNLLSPSWSSSY